MKHGFGVVVGNPPWVSYAGKAAQPLDDGLRGWFSAFYSGFRGFRNLQGLFVERGAALLGAGGRLGLVLPSSMAELKGYEPSREAHDRVAECDRELKDLGEDSFRGVFQPSMVLWSTRRSATGTSSTGAPWPIARPDLDEEARDILARMSGDPLPSHLFGERGFQSTGTDVEHMLAAPTSGTVPIRVGSDIQAFQRRPASLHAETAWFGHRLRDPSEWAEIKVLIRQTARVPMAVRSDGAAFRNSILAGFEDDEYSADFLVAYLNSTPIRWFHFNRNRDARMGIPQVKIGHLRAIPAPGDATAIGRIEAIGAACSATNAGIGPEEQQQLDKVVAQALGLGDDLPRMRADAKAWS